MTHTPRECRSGRKCDPQTIKEAIDCLAHHSALSLPQICERSGLDYNRMAKACSLYEKRIPRFDELEAMTANSADDPRDRNLVVLRYWARQRGCAIVVLPTANLDQDDAFFGAMTAATERLSAMGREIHESLRNDNQIDDGEESKILARTFAMHEQIAAIEEMVKRRRQQQPAKPEQQNAGLAPLRDASKRSA